MMPLSKKRMQERKQQDRSNLTDAINRGTILDVCVDIDKEYPPPISAVAKLDRHVKPKYPLGILYPDGRMRLPDMAVVIPKECEAWSVYEEG